MCPGDAFVSPGKYFTPYFKHEADSTKLIVAEGAHKVIWNYFFPTGFKQESCIDAVSIERNI